jgi:hypothetical protein
MRRAGAGINRRSSGGGPRGMGGGGLADIFTPLDVPPALRAFWYREQVTLSGSDITGVTDKYATWGDATTPLGDPNLGSPSTFFSRGESWVFDETTSDHFQIGGTLAQQRALHFPPAAGIAFGLTFRFTKAADTTLGLLGNGLESAATSSMNLRGDTGADAVHLTVNNGTGTDMVNVITADGSTPENTTHSIVIALRDHASEDDYQVYLDGSLHLSGTFVGAPSNADAPSAARIAARGGGISWFFVGEMSEAIAVLDYSYAPALAAYLHSQVV